MRPCPIRILLMAIAVVGAGAAPVCAQAGRVAVFAEAAAVDAHAWESDWGRMAMYGGELVVRLRGAVYAGFDVEQGRISRTDRNRVSTTQAPFSKFVETPFEFRQTAVMVSVFREWPRTSRIRALAGGGVGCLVQHVRGVRYYDMEPWSGDPPTVFALHARGGIVGTVTEHLRVRADGVLSMGYGVMGLVGARVGLGYVF
jgi:hypothetical protein